MATCSNCGKNIGCSCKLRTAKDGKRCCTACIGSYEATLSKPTKENINNTAPLNVIANYQGIYKN